MTKIFHKISEVKALENLMLWVKFETGEIKIYDVKPWLNDFPVFCVLQNQDFFSKVRVDAGGYAVIWNDEIDLACNELWYNGEEIQEATI